MDFRLLRLLDIHAGFMLKLPEYHWQKTRLPLGVVWGGFVVGIFLMWWQKKGGSQRWFENPKPPQKKLR